MHKAELCFAGCEKAYIVKGAAGHTKAGEDMEKSKERWIKICGGVLVGLVNGFFGGGGGMLIVPMLEKILHVPTKRAHATAILIILPICAASAAIYLANGYFSAPLAISAGIGVVAGGAAGALLLRKLPSFVIGILFAVMMVAVGARLAVFR